MSVGRRSQPDIRRAPTLGSAPQRGASRLVTSESSATKASGTTAKKPSPVRRPAIQINWAAVSKRLSWLALLAGLLLGGYELGKRLLPYVNPPIKRVMVQGELPHVSPQAVQQRMEAFVEQPFFQVDLVGIRQELEQIPWVARAEVRRVWPDRIVVHLAEQMPIARWGSKALLNNQGQAFIPSDAGNYEHLPYLNGPQRAQQKVMHQYQILSQMLRPMGFSIIRLELRDRGSWFLTTGQGIELLLGRDQVLEKIRRFNSIYQKALETQRDNIARIDLRHANGLAVAWREPAPGTVKAAVPSKN